MEDKKIIEILTKGGSGVHQVLDQLYVEYRPMILNHVLKNSGNKEEAKDLLQDSIIAFYLNIKKGKFGNQSTLKTYFLSIAKNQWLSKLKKRNKESSVDMNEQEYSEEYLNKYLSVENQIQIENVFSQLGDMCKKILEFSFFYNYSNQELLESLSYKNVQVVRNQKHKCIHKLKDIFRENPNLKSLLTK